MSDESFKELAAALTHTARSAGELILRYRGQNADVRSSVPVLAARQS